jgi:hypothetical protein
MGGRNKTGLGEQVEFIIMFEHYNIIHNLVSS